MLNFFTSIVEVMLDVTFFLVDPVGETGEVLESSDFSSIFANFANILNSFCTEFLDGSSALFTLEASSDSVPGSKSKLFNFCIRFFEGIVDFLVIFSLEESFHCFIITSSEEPFGSTFMKVHKSSNFNSIFASILDSV